MMVIGKLYAQTFARRIVGHDDQIQVTLLEEQLTGKIRLALTILLVAVGLVWLIACANVVDVLVARAIGRQTEIAISTVMGSGRVRLVLHMLAKRLLLDAA